LYAKQNTGSAAEVPLPVEETPFITHPVQESCGFGFSLVNEPLDRTIQNSYDAERLLQESKCHSASKE